MVRLENIPTCTARLQMTTCSLSGKEQQSQTVNLVAFCKNFKRPRNFSSYNFAQRKNEKN